MYIHACRYICIYIFRMCLHTSIGHYKTKMANKKLTDCKCVEDNLYN